MPENEALPSLARPRRWPFWRAYAKPARPRPESREARVRTRPVQTEVAQFQEAGGSGTRALQQGARSRGERTAARKNHP